MSEERRGSEGNEGSTHRSMWTTHEWLNMSRKIVRQGFYWSTMEADCVKLVKHYHDYQAHGNLNYFTWVVRAMAFLSMGN